MTTKTVGLAQPFVWLYVKTADDDYTNPVRLPLTGSDFLLEFQDDTVFTLDDSIDVPGTGQSKTARAMTRIRLMDPAFTYLEGLFVRNRYLSFEYGWTDDNGNVLETSGSVRAMVSSIKPRFTYSGTELDVTLVSDLSVGNEGNDVAAMLNSTTISSKLFRSKHSQGFEVKGAGIDISKLAKDNDVYEEPSKAIHKPNPELNALISSAKALSPPASTRAPKGQKLAIYLLSAAASITKFERISDIVAFIAEICGMEHDIDETALCPYDIYLVNKTLYSFIKDDLVTLAGDDKGVRDYRFWIRGNKLYFKNAQRTEAVKKLEFIGDNKSVSDRFADPQRKSIVLDFTLDLVPNLVINSASVSTKGVGFNPLDKKMTGRHAAVIKSPEIMASIHSEIISIDRQDNRETASVGFASDDIYGGRQELNDISKAKDDISRSSYSSVQSDWLVWETASQLANYFTQQSPSKDKFTEDKLKLAAYRALLKRRNAGLDKELYQPSDATASIQASDVKTLNRKPNVNDPTKAGRMYVLPYADSRAADLAEGILASSMKGPFMAKCTCYGDPTMRLLQSVLMLVHTPEGFHYSSGRYLVTGLVNKIDASGFTTEISMTTDGVANQKSISELIAEADGPSPEDYAKANAKASDDQLSRGDSDKVDKPVLPGGAVEALWSGINGDD